MNIQEITEQAYEINEEKGFHEGWINDPVQILARIALLHSEASEALEAVRDGAMEMWFRDNGKPEGYITELADVIIRVCDMAKLSNLDLESAIRAKLAYNKSRPKYHGRPVKAQ